MKILGLLYHMKRVKIIYLNNSYVTDESRAVTSEHGIRLNVI